MTGSTDKEMSLGSIVGRWSLNLHPSEDGDEGEPRRGDRAARARLRRAATVAEALMLAETVQLVDALSRADEGWLSDRITRALYPSRRRTGGPGDGGVIEAVGCVAALLAEAPPAKRVEQPPMLATLLGQTTEGKRPGEGERARLSMLRFTRVMRADDWDDRLREMRRALALTKRVAFDVPGFARDLLRWDDERIGEQIRQRWIFAYHQQYSAGEQYKDRKGGAGRNRVPETVAKEAAK